MKTFILVIALLTTFSVNRIQATDVALEGYWSASINNSRSYSYYGYSMSGRYSRMGAGYYRYGRISGGDITNNDYYSYYSGSLSLEFWRLSYYGGTSGSIMFTRGYSGLSSGYFYSGVYQSGYFRSPGRYGYGDISLSEYDYGWYEVDDIPFSRYRYY